MTTEQPRILVVCGRNKKRSKTAEQLFRKDGRLQIRSAGVSPKAERRLTEKDLHWADLVLVMETDQRDRIQEGYAHLDLPVIEVLHIPDDYEFMDEELVEMLRDRMEDVLMNLNRPAL